jgi:predicted nucleic acid-binding protein
MASRARETRQKREVIVDCAICANAKYLVTNDRHYDILKEIPFPKVDIIALQEFAETIHKL